MNQIHLYRICHMICIFQFALSDLKKYYCCAAYVWWSACYYPTFDHKVFRNSFAPSNSVRGNLLDSLLEQSPANVLVGHTINFWRYLFFKQILCKNEIDNMKTLGILCIVFLYYLSYFWYQTYFLIYFVCLSVQHSSVTLRGK